MQAMFGGLIAIMLLGVYVWLGLVATKIVNCLSRSGYSDYTAAYFNDQMSFYFSTIGGLVSALVIAQLAITPPRTAPGVALLGSNPTPTAALVVKIIAVSYVIVWVVTGFWSVVLTMYHPTALPPLASFAHAWLGLDVAAGYAYFGLKQS